MKRTLAILIPLCIIQGLVGCTALSLLRYPMPQAQLARSPITPPVPTTFGTFVTASTFSVLSYTTSVLTEPYPDLGCLIGSVDIRGKEQGVSNITTFAYRHTEALATKPLAILQDTFDNQTVTCLFVNAAFLGRSPHVIVTDADGHNHDYPITQPAGIVLVTASETPPYTHFVVVDGQQNIMYETQTADKGFP